jgi:hypothetical protein
MRCGGYAFYVHAHSIVGTIPTIFYAPRYSGGAMRQKEAKPPRAALFLLLCGLC